MIAMAFAAWIWIGFFLVFIVPTAVCIWSGCFAVRDSDRIACAWCQKESGELPQPGLEFLGIVFFCLLLAAVAFLMSLVF